MQLSIVVPTLNEAARIERTLAALKPMRAAGHEVIVVDGGSLDTTMSRARRFADRVAIAPRGRASQMNAGARFARGDTLLFLHADCLPPADALDAIARARASGHRWGRFDVAIDGRSRLLPMVAAMMNLRSGATGIVTGDQGLFVDRALFAEAGGFPSIPLMEDVALSASLKRIGGHPARLRQRIVTSGRRWDSDGALRTIATMWTLRVRFALGADPADLAADYGMRTPFCAPTLQVFARDPQPGQVKSRLAAGIGATQAASVYRSLAERTLRVACAAREAGLVEDIELWCDPVTERDAFLEWRERFNVRLLPQTGDHLGERMRHALHGALSRGRPAILVGTDCPVLDVASLGRAASALADCDAVFGPSEDGGYVLVGLSRPFDVFTGIAWGTPGVMATTRKQLADREVSWRELPTLWDIDTIVDLARWRSSAPSHETFVA